MRKPKLTPIPFIKKALFADWALRVKQRDGWKCLLCGSEENLTAHHWHICDHHAHAARYCVDNGATLCYTCHIRGVHQRADHFITSRIYAALRRLETSLTRADLLVFKLKAIESLSDIEITTEYLRRLYSEMQKRAPVKVDPYDIVNWTNRGAKRFMTIDADMRLLATIGNRIAVDREDYLVKSVAKAGNAYRYTLVPFVADEVPEENV